MRALHCIAAVVVLGGTLTACADPYYYNRSGYYQGYAYPSYYNRPGVTVAYTTGPSYAYSYPASYPAYGYSSGGWDSYRNYRGIHPGPEYYP